MDNTDIVIARLRTIAQRAEAFETAAEIARATDLNGSTVSGILRRLARGGRVRQAGEAFSGGKTWTVTDFD